MEDKVSRLEEKVKETTVILDSLTEVRLKSRLKESVKEMEDKVAVAKCALKLLNVDIGRETSDRREIVRKTIDVLRSYSPDDVKYLDRLLRRTRIIILGKGTVRKDNYAGTPEYFVPTLLQCRDKGC